MAAWARALPVIGLSAVAIAFGLLVSGLMNTGPSVEPSKSSIRVLPLRVEPDVLVPGGAAVLFMGICNDSDRPITAQVWFGAEQVESGLLQAPRVDLMSHTDAAGARTPVTDTEVGRARRTIRANGCEYADPIRVEPIPPVLTPGRWMLVLHVISSPLEVDITVTSPRFEYRLEGGLPKVALEATTK